MTIKQVHFIGVGGIGMSALARIALYKKMRVTGSDCSENDLVKELRNLGATVFVGHAANHIPADATVVYSSAIDKNNPEMCFAQEKNLPLLHRSEFLRILAEGEKALSVTGTHGKTTTSSLLAHVLMQVGKDPSFALGGVLHSQKCNGRGGAGEYFVIEADESDGSFLNLPAYGGIVTNIDFDHMDFYGTEEHLLHSFQRFISSVQSPSHFLWCGDDPYLQTLEVPGQSYGFNEYCDWQITEFKQSEWNLTFSLQKGKNQYRDITVPLIGRFNALNTAAVFALCTQLGIEEGEIRCALNDFQGVARRGENYTHHHVTLVNDYAHHPTEIRATIEAVRKAVGERRLIVAFQPHRYSRMRHCMGQFAALFREADDLFVTDVYAAGEEPIENVKTECILKEIREGSTINLTYCPREDLEKVLWKELRPHDVLLLLGAGDISQSYRELCKRLATERPQRTVVGVLYGGASTEHDVSLMSVQFVLESLDPDVYEARLFGLDKHGGWHVGEAAAKILSKEAAREPSQQPLSTHVMQAIQECDIFFPVLHGPYGEDGMPQGFFEMIRKPYVGCDHRASALCMDKAFTKYLIQSQGIPTADFVAFDMLQWKTDPSQLLSRCEASFDYPVVVKPSHLGSSIGIVLAHDRQELVQAIHHVFLQDNRLVVERYIHGRELEFATLGNDTVEVPPPGEILKGTKMYDYQAKYSDDAMPTAVCADLPPELVEKGKALATQAYQAVGCTGLARIDFFLDEHGKYWLNEINPIPGLTRTSLYHQMWKHWGLEGQQLIHKLIVLGLDRWRRQQRQLQRGKRIVEAYETSSFTYLS